MKKFVLLLLAVFSLVGLVGCSCKEENGEGEFKVGFILIGDENEGYSLAHLNGINQMKEALGLKDSQIVYKKHTPEGKEAQDAAEELVGAGCKMVFANSFGHEEGLFTVAAEHPEVHFLHATGIRAKSSGLPNVSNFFVDIFEARYVAGIYGGVRLNELIASNAAKYAPGNKVTIGYVGAKAFAEVKSGFTAFYLGVRSALNPAYELEMKVQYTGEWANQVAEKNAATALIDSGCVLISQHADTVGAATACEEKSINNIGYNVSMLDAAPTQAITSAGLNWGVYYTYAVREGMAGRKPAVDWCEGFKEGAVAVTEVNRNAFGSDAAYNEANQKAEAAIAAIKAGTLHVFDTSKFTVGGETVTSTKDVEGFYGKEYIKTKDGVSYFAESDDAIGSAPGFAFVIDGIIELNQAF